MTTRKSKPAADDEIEDLRRRLEEAEDALRAIREGEVDAIVVSDSQGERVYSLDGSQDLYRLIVETMKESALTVDPDGTVLFCNQQLVRFIGRPQSEIVGHRLGELVAADDRPLASRLVKRSQERPTTQHLVFQRPDGQTLPAHVSATVLHQPDGISICIVATDVSELEASSEMLDQLRQQQEALTRSKARLRAIFTSSQDALVVVDDEGRCLEANPAAEELFLLPVQQLVGRRLTEFTGEAPDLPANLERMLVDARYAGELSMRRSDGTQRTVEVHAVANILPGQHLAVVRDVSESRRAERLRVATSRQLKALMDAVPVGVSFSFDADSERISGNPALFAQFEMTPLDNVSATARDSEAAGRRVRYFQNGRELSGAELPLQRAVAENRAVAPLELEVQLPSGRRWFAEVSGAPVHESEGQLIGGIAVTVDVTERKRAEERLAASLKEKELLLKEIHHRVKNNLQIVASMLNLQLESVRDPEQRFQLMESQNRVRTIALIHEKLYRSTDLARIPFAAYAQDLTRIVHSSFGEAGELVRLSFDVEEVEMGVDAAIPAALVLNELVSNALKHAFPAGRKGLLTVRLSRLDKGSCELAVEDDGIGFPPGLDLRHTSTLGLQLVDVLATQLGGSAALAARAVGSRVVLTFPIAAPA